MAKRQIDVVVQMYGGTIQDVVVADKDVSLNVVFLEDRKYSDGEEFEVKSGAFKGDIVFTHQDSSPAKKRDIEGVLKAADERCEAARKEAGCLD